MILTHYASGRNGSSPRTFATSRARSLLASTPGCFNASLNRRSKYGPVLALYALITVSDRREQFSHRACAETCCQMQALPHATGPFEAGGRR